MRRASVMVLVLFIGCAANRPTVTDLPHVGSGLERIAADANDAAGHVERAKPHTNGIGRVELNGASVSLEDAKAELEKTRKAYDAATKQVQTLATDRDTLAADLKAEQGHWVGFKTRQLAKWVVLAVVGSWLTLGIAGMLMKGLATGGLLFSIGQHLLRALPLANVFSWGANRLSAAGSPVQVTVNTGEQPKG